MANTFAREEAAEAQIGGDLEHVRGNTFFDHDIGCEVSVPASSTPKRRLATDAQKQKAKEARKQSGYTAFSKGTSKQKAWAETIRADIENQMPSDLKGMMSDITDATVFINNRSNVSFFIAHAQQEKARIDARNEAKMHVVDESNDEQKLRECLSEFGIEVLSFEKNADLDFRIEFKFAKTKPACAGISFRSIFAESDFKCRFQTKSIKADRIASEIESALNKVFL